MPKSIGVITMYKSNYGAFLQAYALQKTLQKLGFTSELIRYDYCRDRTILGVPLLQLKQPLSFMKMLVIELLKYQQHHSREKVFDESIEKHLRESAGYYGTYKELAENPPKYDIYLTGSDQVFNPKLIPQALKSRLLCFVDQGIRASYAASAGESTIPRSAVSMFQRELTRFQSISVREEDLKESLEKQLGIAVERNIDPTFLLTEEEWGEFGEDGYLPSNQYIFYYRVLPQKELMEYTERLSKQLNLPVFVADRNDTFTNQIQRKGHLSPEQWVGMLKNASYVVTNSFHGTAFSINLKKKIFVLMPPRGGTRITDILSKCNLERLLDSRIIEDRELSVMYTAAERYLTTERQRAFAYLMKLSQL